MSWLAANRRRSHRVRFEYSKVDPRMVEQARRDPFKAVPKPRLTNGETKKCPGCAKASLYRGFDLFYSRDETVLVAAAASD
jgi:hypothetical protein